MIFEQVKEIINEVLGKKEITESTTLDDLGADSLDLVEIVMAVEDKFGIEVDSEKVLELKTVADVINYIEKATK